MEKLDFDACSCKTNPLLKVDSFQKTLEKKKTLKVLVS